jgi:hypothetical protein
MLVFGCLKTIIDVSPRRICKFFRKENKEKKRKEDK